MASQNICKFITESAHSDLKPVNFVYEQNPDTQARKIVLSHHTVYLISEGAGTMVFSGTPIPVKGGELIFGFSGEEFHGNGEKLKYFYISFSGGRATELFRRFGITSMTRRFPGHEGMIPFWEESIARAREENLDLVSESVLSYAFSRLTGVREARDGVALRMLNYAEENFSEPDLTLTSLAEKWGYNPKYLSDSFKKRVGVGFSRYLAALRIKHAVFLMDHGVEAVKNIAFLCGFQDPLYFSKVFRRTVGTSPSEYLRDRNGRSLD